MYLSSIQTLHQQSLFSLGFYILWLYYELHFLDRVSPGAWGLPALETAAPARCTWSSGAALRAQPHPLPLTYVVRVLQCLLRTDEWEENHQSAQVGVPFSHHLVK